MCHTLNQHKLAMYCNTITNNKEKALQMTHNPKVCL